MKQVLFVSGSIGLGHVGRDLEIAGALRKLHPDVEISWMVEPPALDVLRDTAEKVLPEADLLCSRTTLHPSNILKPLSPRDNELHARDNAEQFSAIPVQPKKPPNQPETKTAIIVTQWKKPLCKPKN